MVPVDGAIRGALRSVVYTALPRPISQQDERIGYRKHLSYAHETECRLPDGTRVPRGARIKIMRGMLDVAPGSAHLDTLERLRGVVDVDFI